MIRNLVPAALLAASLIAIPSLPGSAREQVPAENREWGYSAMVSTCDSPSVLSEIQSRFSGTERHYWNSAAEIVAIEGIRQAAFRPHGLDYIPRRYCQAVAVMENQRRLKLRYAIIEKAGFAGYGEGIQFCLEGYDRNHTAMPGCDRLDR